MLLLLLKIFKIAEAGSVLIQQFSHSWKLHECLIPKLWMQNPLDAWILSIGTTYRLFVHLQRLYWVRPCVILALG